MRSGKTHKQKQEDLGISVLRGRLNLKSEQNNKYYEDIIETIRDPLIVLDSHLRVLYTNRNFIRTFKVTARKTIGNLIYVFGNRQWDIPALRELPEDILPQKAVCNEQSSVSSG